MTAASDNGRAVAALALKRLARENPEKWDEARANGWLLGWFEGQLRKACPGTAPAIIAAAIDEAAAAARRAPLLPQKGVRKNARLSTGYAGEGGGQRPPDEGQRP